MWSLIEAPHPERVGGLCSAALVAALAGVFLVVGSYATLQAAHLAMASGVANALGGNWAGGGFAVSFGAKFFGHERTPLGW